MKTIAVQSIGAHLSFLYAWTFERSVPPHPGPLPQGEGERFGSARASHRLVTDRPLLELRCAPTNPGRTQAQPIVRLNRYGSGRGSSGLPTQEPLTFKVEDLHTKESAAVHANATRAKNWRCF